MKKKKSPVNRVLVILLILSLCANAVLAILLGRSFLGENRQKDQSVGQVEQEPATVREQEETILSEKVSQTEPVTQGTDLEKGEERETETEREKETESETEEQRELLSESEERISSGGPVPELLEKIISSREELGETWAVSIEMLGEGKEKSQVFEYHGDEVMQSASVIKVFIMGAVYDRMCYPSSPDRLISMEESYEGELRDLLEKMITVSDNEAANRLVELLGQGDFQAGAEVVNQFCRENGFDSTSLGRRFLEENPEGDNYTSAADCRKILSMIYEGTCVGKEASEKMLEILKQQTNTSKIPSGLPEGTQTANKTGEMPEGYNLGCIENDMAIVYSQRGTYILTVLSNNLEGRNSQAQQAIREISSLVWEWVSSQEEEHEPET